MARPKIIGTDEKLREKWSDAECGQRLVLAHVPKIQLIRPTESGKSSLISSITSTGKKNIIGNDMPGQQRFGDETNSTKHVNSIPAESTAKQLRTRESTVNTTVKEEIALLLGSTDQRNCLQAAVDTLASISIPADLPRLLDQYKDVDVQSAKTTYTPHIVHDSSDEHRARGKCRLQLAKHMLTGAFYISLCESLFQWCSETICCIWTSDTLAADLNLPMTQSEPPSVDVQAFVLADGKPPILLTVFDPQSPDLQSENEDKQTTQSAVKRETELVRAYTVDTGRLLSAALLNYCCCNFVILPIVLNQADFDLEKLNEEITKQTKACEVYYMERIVLDTATYESLKLATTLVACTTYLPSYLKEIPAREGTYSAEIQRFFLDNMMNAETELLVQMDTAWHAVTSLLIEELVFGDPVCAKAKVKYPEDVRFQMAVAVMEAAKRLSYANNISIIERDGKLEQCLQPLKEKVKEDTGVELSLNVERPENASETTLAENFVIVFDCPEWEPPPTSHVLWISSRDHSDDVKL